MDEWKWSVLRLAASLTVASLAIAFSQSLPYATVLIGIAVGLVLGTVAWIHFGDIGCGIVVVLLVAIFVFVAFEWWPIGTIVAGFILCVVLVVIAQEAYKGLLAKRKEKIDDIILPIILGILGIGLCMLCIYLAYQQMRN